VWKRCEREKTQRKKKKRRRRKKRKKRKKKTKKREKVERPSRMWVRSKREAAGVAVGEGTVKMGSPETAVEGEA
jgi:hypothetical protein